jgi:hypothetical protein
MRSWAEVSRCQPSTRQGPLGPNRARPSLPRTSDSRCIRWLGATLFYGKAVGVAPSQRAVVETAEMRFDDRRAAVRPGLSRIRSITSSSRPPTGTADTTYAAPWGRTTWQATPR